MTCIRVVGYDDLAKKTTVNGKKHVTVEFKLQPGDVVTIHRAESDEFSDMLKQFTRGFSNDQRQ
jgi:protein involved in polysaccharide export with SLBB domain